MKIRMQSEIHNEHESTELMESYVDSVLRYHETVGDPAPTVDRMADGSIVLTQTAGEGKNLSKNVSTNTVRVK